MVEAQAGDRTAYRALLDDIGPIVRQFVRRRVRDPEEAKDVYQEVLMALHGARHTYEPGRPLEPWLFAIARRVVSHRQARRFARDARELLPGVLPDVPIDDDGHVKLHLEQALRALSSSQRQALALLKVDGLSLETAARRARTTTGALKVRLHRAYHALLRLL